MDGTALGILGTLTSFRRAKENVRTVRRISDQQYVIASPKCIRAVDEIFRSAKNADVRSLFHVKLKSFAKILTS